MHRFSNGSLVIVALLAIVSLAFAQDLLLPDVAVDTPAIDDSAVGRPAPRPAISGPRPKSPNPWMTTVTDRNAVGGPIRPTGPLRLRKKATVQVQQVYEAIPAKDLENVKKWRSLAGQIKAADDSSQREELGEQLRTLLEGIFDEDFARRDAELKQLEARVQKLRDGLNRRKQNRDRIVTVQVDSVMLDAQGLSLFEGLQGQTPGIGLSLPATSPFHRTETVVDQPLLDPTADDILAPTP